MLDHIGLVVSDYPTSKRFYEAALGAIGYQKLMEFPAAVTGSTDVAGFGEPGKADLWIHQGPALSTPLPAPSHVAFRVKDRATVDAFYRAALAAGGRDNGEPGLRPHYHAHYYGAFVLDPDGHNIEAVCHDPA